ncbi:recombinase family protein [Romboutsia sedimentorum]|uniref:Recombinase family protein n=1 Tax=Romboutsia sedimentorum TaxID=1368474 RepID=A0ABT7E606_9FIRM|nr:recombinase family protein [Romboutsia sedimentorum]MDK2562317.1 recombinase family protein [Romboutsia sedimentorum]
MRKFFYARISTKDQVLDRQIVKAKNLEIEEEYIFLEVASGKDFKRPDYQLLSYMAEDERIRIKTAKIQV